MIKLASYKRFEYTPRHYDPDKEELDARVRQIKQELGYEMKGSHKTTLKRGSFRQTRQQTKTKANRATNIRLVVILALLFIIAYLIFFA